MLLSRSLALSCVLGGLVSSLSAQGAVHVVDPNNGPGTDFVNLTVAVDQASPGDTLLMRGHPTQKLVIDGKSLNVVSDTGFTTVFNAIEVKNLAPDQTVVLRGMWSNGQPGSLHGSFAVQINDCQGRVWIEDAEFWTRFTLYYSGGFRVRNSAAVVFSNCIFDSRGTITGGVPAALVSENSSVYLLDSQVEGPFVSAAGAVAPALRLTGGRAYLSGTTVTGRDG